MDQPIKYYDWCDFFAQLSASIDKLYNDPQRDILLHKKAIDTFAETDPILKYPFTDPLSFLYALAQRNTVNQSDLYFARAIEAFDLTCDIPTDLIFPTPTPSTPTLFYNDGMYIDRSGHEVGSIPVWDLFHAVHTRQQLDDQLFKTILSLKNVGVVKLTQVMFLIDPGNYIPFDTHMNSLPIPNLFDLKVISDQIKSSGLQVYLEAIKQLKSFFSGCNLYEVNLFNWLINIQSAERLRISTHYCQISTWAEGQGDSDYFDEFVKTNAVWTGGPTGTTGHRIYPLDQFKPGDVVLVRRGTTRLGGIGIVIRNGYTPDGWAEDRQMDIIWLIKDTRKIKDEKRLGQWIGFDKASDKTLGCFQDTYPETFNMLDYIRNTQRKIMDHTKNKHKNIILSGPPGTGKTRKALQIAKWLTSNDHSVSLLDAIDQDIFTDEDVNIDDLEEVELVQFHPSYTYEDFVRGMVTVSVDDKLHYRVQDRILARMAREAAMPENAAKAYVLIIDEINRANLSAVLGELIYALEYRGRRVETLYEIEKDAGLIIPENLYVIGTMNTADRSIGHIDYAIRRRFAFISMLPKVSALKYPESIVLYNKIDLIFAQHTAGDFDADDVKIGHSYFLGAPEDIPYRLKYEIKPILREYLRDGILLKSAEPLINELSY